MAAVPSTAFKVLPRIASAAVRAQPRHEREVTIYVRGFMTDGFEHGLSAWVAQHHKMVSDPRHAWMDHSFAYTWQSGSSRLNFFVPWSNMYWNLLHVGLTVIPSPALIAILVSVDAFLHAVKLARHFALATQRSSQTAIVLARGLSEIRGNYDHIRVVAHSLGCNHVLSAIELVPTRRRPDIIHFLAPSIREDAATERILRSRPASKTYVYYSHADRTLHNVFQNILRSGPMGCEPAIGEVGFRNGDEAFGNVGVRAFRVTRSKFGHLVHTGYTESMHRIIEPE